MTEDLRRLEDEFHDEMLEILEREKEVGFNSTRFRQMLARYPGAETAHLLLSPSCVTPPIFARLREMKRLDLAMESFVVLEKYRPLFSDDEREIARWRLDRGD
jgi:hypothetical protein